MAYRDGDETVVFEGVKVIDRRPPEKQERSVLCEFPDGAERFVSREQVAPWCEFPELGEVFDLEVTRWLADRWEAEGPPEYVVIPNVVVLRVNQAETAIHVRVPALKDPAWVPLAGVPKTSPVRGEGDAGELWLKPWCAEKKGWANGGQVVGGGPPPGNRRSAPNIGDDARRGYGGDDLENPFPHGQGDDDDIPFDRAPGGCSGGRTNEGLLQMSSAEAGWTVLPASADGGWLPREMQGVRERGRQTWVPRERRGEARI